MSRFGDSAAKKCRSLANLFKRLMAVIIAAGAAGLAVLGAGGYAIYRFFSGGARGNEEDESARVPLTREDRRTNLEEEEEEEKDNIIPAASRGGPQRSPLKRTANDGGLDYTTDEAAKLILFSPSPPYGSFTPPASSPLGATKHTHRSNETGKPLPSKPAVTRSPPPPVAPKPKPQGATPSSSLPRRPKVTPGAVSIMPPGMASQVAAAARYKKRIPGGVRSEEEGVSPMVVRSGGREGDNPVSFDEPIRTPVLKTPPRNKGPANRRPPTRH